jgi:putative transposase
MARECNKMDEKLRFVAWYLDGEKIAGLCREFGISRVTGHKIIDRYKDSGIQAFTDRSKRPFRLANQLPFQIENLILQVKKEFPHWGGSEDPGAANDPLPRYHSPSQKHGACGLRSPRAGA